MIGPSERLILLSIFFILLRVNRLLVVIVWAFFLVMQLTTVSLDLYVYFIIVHTVVLQVWVTSDDL